MKKLPGFAAPLILVVIGLVVGIGITFAYFQIKSKSNTQPQQTTTSQSTPTPTPPTNLKTTDETSNWETYTNTEDRITLNYPSNYQLKKSTSDTGVKFYLPNAKQNTLGVMIGGGFQVIVKDVNTTSLETAADQFFTRGKLNLCQKTPNIKLDDTEAVRCDYKPRGEGESPEDIAMVFLLKDNKSYLIHAWASGKDAEGLIKNFDQILSTFKFLN